MDNSNDLIDCSMTQLVSNKSYEATHFQFHLSSRLIHSAISMQHRNGMHAGRCRCTYQSSVPQLPPAQSCTGFMAGHGSKVPTVGLTALGWRPSTGSSWWRATTGWILWGGSPSPSWSRKPTVRDAATISPSPPPPPSSSSSFFFPLALFSIFLF